MNKIEIIANHLRKAQEAERKIRINKYPPEIVEELTIKSEYATTYFYYEDKTLRVITSFKEGTTKDEYLKAYRLYLDNLKK